MTMAGALSVTPVRMYICMSVHSLVHHTQRRPLFKSNSFDQNFMKLGRIVKYYEVFFKFNNGPIASYF